MKTSVKLLLAFATAAAAIAPAAAQQVVAWDEAYRQADARIAQLTLDEKISFMRGYSSFFFYGVPEKGMPYIYLSDATQGVHMRDNLSDPTMVRQLERSTAFPCPISLAATFNPSLAYRYAEAVGEECRAGGIEVLLGPGMNIYRNSQNGRNFEYMGEDPLLASAMVAEYVKGMQSTGTVACLKHFICNDTEFYRRRSNSIVDERALHELYRILKPGGWGILLSPVEPDYEQTYEDDSITDPEERTRIFGQYDHRRIYGADYTDRLREAGFEAADIDYAATFSEAERRLYALPKDHIYVVYKH